jgi:calreticulin
MIPNPDYKPDDKLHAVCGNGCTHVGFELWQVKTGTLFDDIIVTDSLEEAQQYAVETFFKKKEGEAKMHDEVEEKKRAEDAKKAEEMAEHMGEGDDHDHDEDMGFGDEF